MKKKIESIPEKLPPTTLCLSTVCKGCMLAEEDVVNGRLYSSTVRCKSE